MPKKSLGLLTEDLVLFARLSYLRGRAESNKKILHWHRKGLLSICFIVFLLYVSASQIYELQQLSEDCVSASRTQLTSGIILDASLHV